MIIDTLRGVVKCNWWNSIVGS